MTIAGFCPRPRARIAAVMASALLAGCAGAPEFINRPATPVAWPAPDSKPRIELSFAYGGTQDVRRNPGFFQRLFEWIVGSEVTRFVSPSGIVVSAGALWVADTGAACVHRVSFETGEHRVVRGAADAAFQTPIGIAALPNGRVFVTDSTTGRITILDREGAVVRTFGGAPLIDRPTGICFDPHRGRLLVLDTTGCKLLVFDPEGGLVSTTGSRGTALGEFNYPTNLALTSDGGVVVVDSLNFRVQVLSADLQPVRAFGQVGRGPGDFSNPKGIAVDSKDHVYVVDSMFDNVQIFRLDGQLLLTFATRGSALGELYLPTGIHIDATDRIFLADSGNSRIQVLQFSGLQ